MEPLTWSTASCSVCKPPSTNLQWTEAFLKEIKKHDPIVWDGAGFHPHHSEHPNVPEGVHLISLPPFNPIEKLWDLLQDQTANKLCTSIERLEQAVATHLREWWEDAEKVLSLVGHRWQHLQANASAK